jgi:hypothetical protein
LSSENENPSPGQEPGRVSLAEIKKRGRKTNAQIIADYQKSQQTGGQSTPAGQPAPSQSHSPAIILQPRHVEGLSNIPFSSIAGLFKEKDWNLSKDDQEFLSGPLAEFLNEVLPDLARKYPKGAILAICFVSVATKKLAEISAKAPAKIIQEDRQQPPRREGPHTAEVGTDGMTAFERNLRDRGKAIVV